MMDNPVSAVALGAGAGAALGIAATAATVPVVQALGFTAAGVVAESAAAGIMSSAAIAGGGAVTSGSAVAVMQSIGAVAAVPMGIAALAVSVPTVMGVGIAGIVKTCRSGQHESLSAYEDLRDTSTGKWVIATEEGWGNVRVCRYNTEKEAREAFSNIWCSRVLYNPQGGEVQSAGINGWAINTVRRVMAEKFRSR
ncbi:hypothetical protein KRP22_013601 [Phytophthora ramorum]|nr:Interferon alpha-inducible protein 27, mitochondrial [Phytophthora ramorum]